MAVLSFFKKLIQYTGGVFRVFFAALFFSVFGLGALFLSQIVFRILSLFIKDEDRLTDLSRRITASSFKLYLLSGQICRIFKISIEGTDKIAKDKGMIFIANHPSLLDIVLFISVVPHATCLMKEAIIHNPFMKGIARCNRYIANSEGTDEIMHKCKKALSSGDNLIIFPEGTRTIDENKLKFTHGFSSIALTGNFNIRPAVIRFHGDCLRKTTPWYTIFTGILEYRITFLESFDTENFRAQYKDKEDSAVSRLIAKHLQNLIKSRM